MDRQRGHHLLGVRAEAGLAGGGFDDYGQGGGDFAEAGNAAVHRAARRGECGIEGQIGEVLITKDAGLDIARGVAEVAR